MGTLLPHTYHAITAFLVHARVVVCIRLRNKTQSLTTRYTFGKVNPIIHRIFPAERFLVHARVAIFFCHVIEIQSHTTRYTIGNGYPNP